MQNRMTSVLCPEINNACLERLCAPNVLPLEGFDNLPVRALNEVGSSTTSQAIRTDQDRANHVAERYRVAWWSRDGVGHETFPGASRLSNSRTQS